MSDGGLGDLVQEKVEQKRRYALAAAEKQRRAREVMLQEHGVAQQRLCDAATAFVARADPTAASRLGFGGGWRKTKGWVVSDRPYLEVSLVDVELPIPGLWTT